MKIVFGGHPLLFSKHGGLQEQIKSLKTNMEYLGHECYLLHETFGSKLTFDIYHHFGLSLQSVDNFSYGKSISKKVVLSPIFNARISTITKLLLHFIDVLNIKLKLIQSKRTLFTQSDGVNFLSEYEKVLCNIFGVYKSYIILGNGSDKKITTNKNKSGYILQISSVYPHKRVHISMSIAKQMNVPLKVVGQIQDLSYYEKLKRHDWYHMTEFLGFINNKSEIFDALVSSANLVILPSISEVFPISNIESIILGTNVLCTYETSARSEQEKLGVKFVDFNNLDNAVRSAEQLFTHRLSDEFQLIAEKNCSWVRISNDLLVFYKGLL